MPMRKCAGISKKIPGTTVVSYLSRNKVHILNLRVVYERGPPDDIEVRSEIRDGGETRPLDLRGERRAIDRVELVYLAQPSFKGSARVCVFGHP